MAMTYEDQVAIGANLNSAIERTLEQQLGETNPQLIAALAQAVLVHIMRTGKDGDAVYAADKILDRAIGKAAQAQTGENGEGPINHRVLVEFVRAQPMKEIDHE
jgi:hypothetical protein